MRKKTKSFRRLTGIERIRLADFVRSKKEVVESGKLKPSQIVGLFKEEPEMSGCPLNTAHVVRLLTTLGISYPALRKKSVAVPQTPSLWVTRQELKEIKVMTAAVADQLLTLTLELQVKPSEKFLAAHDVLCFKPKTKSTS